MHWPLMSYLFFNLSMPLSEVSNLLPLFSCWVLIIWCEPYLGANGSGERPCGVDSNWMAFFVVPLINITVNHI